MEMFKKTFTSEEFRVYRLIGLPIPDSKREQFINLSFIKPTNLEMNSILKDNDKKSSWTNIILILHSKA
jgi:hypothetical protein